MRLGKAAAAVALFFGLATVVSAAPTGTRAVPARKKHHHLHHVHGVVVSVQYDKAKGHRVIQVKAQHHHHAKQAKHAAAAVSGKNRQNGVMTFRVNERTKFQIEIHNKGRVVRQPANFGDIRTGEHVRVTFDARQHAREVDIFVHQHNKKLPPAQKPPLKKPK